MWWLRVVVVATDRIDPRLVWLVTAIGSNLVSPIHLYFGYFGFEGGCPGPD